MTSALLDIDQLTKSYGGAVTANAQVSFTVQPGEVVGLLGHNGAGKTTLLAQIVGLLRPDAGTIRLAGQDAVANPGYARRCVALQSQSQAPLDGLTPLGAIQIAARLRGMSRSEAKRAAEALIEELDLGPWRNRTATPEGGGLSGGVRRLTSFAMAAVAPVPLLALDEPSNDVDASRRPRLWDALRRKSSEGAGVLLVTHNVTEAERVVDRLVILDQGRVAASGTPAQLRGATDEVRLELALSSSGSDPSAGHADVPFPIIGRMPSSGRVLLRIRAEDAPQAVTWATGLRAEAQIADYSLTPVTLEDTYLAITAAEASAHVHLKESTDA